MNRVIGLGLVSALIGLIVLVAFPFSLTTAYLCLVPLFIGSVIGLACAVKMDLKASDNISNDIVAIDGVEFFAAITMMLKGYHELQISNEVNLVVTTFLVAIAFLAPSLLTVAILTLRERHQKQFFT